jgi:uncharacterized membrane protein
MPLLFLVLPAGACLAFGAISGAADTGPKLLPKMCRTHAGTSISGFVTAPGEGANTPARKILRTLRCGQPVYNRVSEKDWHARSAN